jgi:hypothetical protein
MSQTLAAPSAESTATAAASTPEKYPFFPDNIEYWFEAKRAFGAASYGSSEFGEVMASLSRITSGDDEGWYNEWNATAERISAEDDAQLAAGHRVSARDCYLRAANYFRTSEFFLHGNYEDPRIYSAYKKSIRAYKLSASLFDPPILPVEIPYENTTLPGYFHRVDASDTKRPLLILHTGFDGSAEEMHGEGARAGVERGWNVLAFDGPGQYGPIHRERLPFRPDWEKVVTPVLTSRSRCLALIRKRLLLWASALGAISHHVPQLSRSESRPLSPTTESSISASLSWRPFPLINGKVTSLPSNRKTLPNSTARLWRLAIRLPPQNGL